MAKQSSGIKKVPKVKWPLDDDLPYLYSNNFALLVTDHEVVLVFGSFLPTGLTDHSSNEINNFLGKATIKPLAKVVLSKEGFRVFANMINKKMEIELKDTQNFEAGTQNSDEETLND